MRVYALSDIHLDYSENAQWLAGLSSHDFQDDIMLLAGDIAEDLHLMESCFRQLVSKFDAVVFVPGNHDLWVKGEGITNSIDKFYHLNQLAEATGVITSAYCHRGVEVIPLLGWYDFAFGEPNDQLQQAWVDFRACSWPEGWHVKHVADFFLKKNPPLPANDDRLRISFSHFLPRLDVLPPQIPASYDYLHPIMGSPRLDQLLRERNAKIHVYGHSHISRDVEIEGVRYINNAFGYPSETRIARKRMFCVHETNRT